MQSIQCTVLNCMFQCMQYRHQKINYTANLLEGGGGVVSAHSLYTSPPSLHQRPPEVKWVTVSQCTERPDLTDPQCVAVDE